MQMEAFKDHNQKVVTTGYWPKRDITCTWYPHVSAIGQSICDAVASTEGISSIKVDLNDCNTDRGSRHMVVAIRSQEHTCS